MHAVSASLVPLQRLETRATRMLAHAASASPAPGQHLEIPGQSDACPCGLYILGAGTSAQRSTAGRPTEGITQRQPIMATGTARARAEHTASQVHQLKSRATRMLAHAATASPAPGC